MSFKYKLGIVGYGNMSGAILSGMVSGGALNSAHVLIYDTDEQKRALALTQCFAFAESFERLNGCEYILLATKPQNCAQVFSLIDKSFSKSVLISIMAGITKAKITKSTGIQEVCRCMPNTPAVLRQGVTAVDLSSVKEQKHPFILQMFQSVGSVVQVCESQIDAITAVSGSGPAYVYTFIDAYIAAATQVGLGADTARELVIDTVLGALAMVKERGQDIPTLIDNVCSKGGTTIEAVNVLRGSDFYSIINDAVQASFKRSLVLSKESL